MLKWTIQTLSFCFFVTLSSCGFLSEQIKKVNSGTVQDFSIEGILGGSDTTEDNYLTDLSDTEIKWTSAGNVSSYSVVIKDGSKQSVCNASASVANATFTIADCTLTDGSYTLEVSATSGDVTKPATNSPFSFFVDTTAPSLTYANTEISPTTSGSMTITGNCSDSTTDIQNGKVLICAKRNATCSDVDFTIETDCSGGTYSENLSLTEGVYDIQAKVFDNALNSTTQGESGFIIDSSDPTITFLVSESSPASTDSLTVSGSCSDDGSGIATNGILICIKDSGVCSYPADFSIAENCTAGSYSYSFTASQGSSDFSVRAIDGTGRTSTIEGTGGQNYVVDSIAPSISFGVNHASPTNQTDLQITGTCSDVGTGIPASGIKICIKSTGTCSDSDFTESTNCTAGNYTFDYTTSQNLYDIRVKAVDGAGGESSIQGTGGQNYIVDTTPPSAVTFSNPTSSVVRTDYNYNYQWSASSDTGGSGFKDYTMEEYRTTDCSGGIAATTSAANQTNFNTYVISGENTLKVVVSDNAGNTAETCSSDITLALVSGARQHACALARGKVLCWGNRDSWSLLGDNQTGTVSKVPVETINSENAMTISAGYSHSCALMADNSIKCWGHPGSGKLGKGDTTSSPTAQPVINITNAIDVNAAADSTCALLSTGTVMCWGDNDYGQTGNSTVGTYTDTPIAVDGITNAIAISHGYMAYHHCAVLSDYTVKCWGRGTDGQLGDGNASDSVAPVPVTGITTARAIANGRNATCAILADSTVTCWGSNRDGCLADGTTTQRDEPVPSGAGISGVSTIAIGEENVYVTLTTGEFYCWGDGDQGACGNYASGDVKVPVQITPITNSIFVAAGEWAGFSLGSDGRIVSWGNNSYSRLGLGWTIQYTEPKAVYNAQGTAQIVASYDVNFSILGDGSVLGWGGDYERGVLGLGPGTREVLQPSLNPNLSNVRAMSSSRYHGCATLASGVGMCWGSGYRTGTGVVGIHAPNPVQDYSDFYKITAGDDFSCGLHTDGTISCWGSQYDGVLGQGALVSSEVPLKVPGLSNMVDVNAAGLANNTVCALKATGEVWCWGYNNRGQAGNADFDAELSPNPITGITDATKVTPGAYHTCALESAGTIKCWGDDAGLGNGSIGDTATPVSVPGISTAVDMDSEDRDNYAVLADGSMMHWNSSAPTPVFPSITDAIKVSSKNAQWCVRRVSGVPFCWGENRYGVVDGYGSTYALEPTQVINYPYDDSAPVITFTTIPNDYSASTAGSIGFEANEAVSQYYCNLDYGGWGACDPATYTYSGLSTGPHTIEVYGVDAEGNGTAANAESYTWTIGAITLNAAPFANPVDFGSTPTGTPVDTEFTITNTGTVNAIGILASMSTNSQFKVLNGTCYAREIIGTGGTESCTFNIRFTPDSAATFNDVLTIESVNGGSLTINLQGTGT
jgi:alpha-tubulin suppressor-like RCC1 family protein